MQQNQSYRYDAFISYRHTEPDKTIAETLHRMLETFKVPRSLVKKGCPKRVSRVFRDRDELPTSSNLADNISEALANSEYLIVICSPRTAQSQWVMKEIETFSKLHGQERILALLIEGEPNESFPEPLRFARRQVACEDGSVREVVEEVEPLAADIRADSLRQMKKKLKVEILRLLAPILNCRFDDLRQRHRERAIKRILSLSISLSLFFMAFGSFSAWQALQIRQKSVLLEQQVQKTLEGQSLYMANLSAQLLEEGDRRRAVMVAREALPEDLDNPERPYVEEAEYALSQALHVYDTNSWFVPDIALKNDNIVNFIKLSPDGKTAVTSAQDGYLYVWDTRYGDLLHKHYIGDKYLEKDNLRFIDDKTIICMASNRLICLDIDAMEPKWQYDGSIAYFALSSDSGGVAAGDSENLALLDAGTGEVLFKYPIEDCLEGEGLMTVTSLDWDPEDRYLCLGTNTGQALLFDTQNHRFLGDFRVHNQQITDVAVSDGILAVASIDYSLETLNLLSKGKGMLDVFDFSGNRLIERQFDYSSIGKLDFSPYDKNLLVFTESEKLNVLDISQDELLYTFIHGGNVSDYIIWDGFVVSSSYDGTVRFWVMDDIGWEYFAGRIELSQGIGNLAITSGVMAVSYDYSNKAIILRELQNEDMIKLSGHNDSIDECCFSPDGSKLLSYTYDSGQIAVWNWETKALAGMIETGCDLTLARFTDNGKKIFAAAQDGTLLVYDARTMERLDSRTIGYGVTSKLISSDGSLCVVNASDGVRIIRTADLSTVAKMDDAYFEAAQFYDQNSKVILTAAYGETKIFSVESGEELFTFPEEGIKHIAAGGKGQLLAAIYPDNSIHLLDSRTFEERRIINDFDIAASRVMFDADGRYLFVSMDDFSLRCYEAESGKFVDALKGMSQIVAKIVFDDSRTFLITLGEGSEAIIWRWENRKKLGCVDYLLEVSPDFKTLIGSSNKDLLLIPFYDTRTLAEKAEKQLAGRTLSDEDRANLFISR